MALTYVGASSSSLSGATSVTPGVPTGTAVGDQLFAFVAYKRTGTAPTTPTGWTVAAGPYVLGGGTAGANAGPVGLIVYTRAYDGTASPAITRTGTGSVMICAVVAYRAPGASVAWQATAGAQTTASTNWSVTGADNLGVQAGDDLLIHNALTNSNIGPNGNPTITAPGATLTAATWPDEARFGYQSSSGDKLTAWLIRTSASAGTETAAPTHTDTLYSGSATGGAVFLRVYVAASGPPAVTVSATLTGSGTLTATATPGPQTSAAALSGSGATTGTATVTTTTAAATLTGDGALAATSTSADLTATAPATGTGALSATLTAEHTTATAALAGTGALSATSAETATAAAPLTGIGSLSATVTAESVTATAALAGNGALAATAFLGGQTAAAPLSGVGALSATSLRTVAIAAALLDGDGALSATSTYASLVDFTVTGVTGPGGRVLILSGPYRYPDPSPSVQVRGPNPAPITITAARSEAP